MRYNKVTNNPAEREFISYPYTWWDGVFSEEELAKLTTYCDSLELDKGKVGTLTETGSVELKTRNSDICFFNRTLDNHWIFDRFNAIVENLNDQFYGFDLQGYDSIQYGTYDSVASQHYTWHMDSHHGPSENIMMMRKFSLAFLLNEPGVDFEGGEFEINQGNQNEPMVADTKKNRVVAFPSWTIHRVKPVTKGIRKSLVLWVVGPKFK